MLPGLTPVGLDMAVLGCRLSVRVTVPALKVLLGLVVVAEKAA